ncbi:MAG: bifunctional phosphopantothenoylcysteine decarboxylase/phosphopantothenate--cysteine ligase CoaBC [Chloroflexi bacterium]|nr:bifunctional phosphopantothenoylcysteine decarboxylase/phosphopantothenate--cysteine ligase CoaBC [Chloroflexota bacterium]MBU1751654.1 bifunctional phosphopantothenoylcysteine decarboxylase/phosphopantothenate--cysteine ligase CoaBC [Chloroflexota bacterium]
MPSPLQGKYIVLGVTGSIAAYKAVDLASKLTQAGARVDTVLTDAATRFVAPITFQSVTGRPAYTDADLWGAQAHVLHVGLGRQADLLVIAPISAQTIAKLAHGLADNLLTLATLAAECLILLAPAMDGGMYAHTATQENLRVLRDRGAIVVGPEEGHLASGLKARGRMTEPVDILGHVRYHVSRGGPLAGQRVVVTAGGTQEPIDPVRYIANRSSGKQGYALAQAALDAGADVVLVTAPTALPTPAGAEWVDVRTAAEMADAVLQACGQADALLMAAAVADFRPAQAAAHKLKKAGGAPTLPLEPTTDILAAVARQRQETGHPRVVVGFAAETQDLLTNARAKLHDKGLDLIVANDVSADDAGFAVDTNRVTLLSADGSIEALPLLSKMEVAEEVIERVIAQLDSSNVKRQTSL